jgi:leader peptidase (prepilin peptidase)/N-methyltransferase
VSILYWSGEFDLTRVVFSVTGAMLFNLSIVDWNTQYIPVEYTGVILICGLIRLLADVSNWWEYVIGLIAVSGFLYVVDRIGTPIMRRRYPEDDIDGVIGDGDIKLMAATGLLIGWKLNFLALGIGCVIGSIIHVILMKIKGSGIKLALGPYLSLGVYITMICGEQLVSWYLNMIGINISNISY